MNYTWKNPNPLWIIVIATAMLALMDGFNFYWPHNKGFFSLTYGVDRITVWGFSADAWHMLKRLLIADIIYGLIGLHYLDIRWWAKVGLLAFIAAAMQGIIYNGIIKIIFAQ